jgi:hypothetical protein
MRAPDTNAQISRLRARTALPLVDAVPPIVIGHELIAAVAFNFSSGFQVLGAVPAGSICNRVAIRVDTALALGAQLTFGTTTNPNLFASRLDIVGQFEDDALFSISTADILVMTVSPNASISGGGILFYKVLVP